MRAFERKKQEILDRVDLLDVVSEHVTLKRSGQRWLGLCPFHTEKTPSFTVNPQLGFFKCFGCGKGGDVFSFVQFRENVSFGEALRMLADRAGVELNDRAGRESDGGPGRTDLARVNAWAMTYFRKRLLDESLGRSAREYVASRGISEATAEQFGLGLAIESGRPSLEEAGKRAGFDVPLLLAADLLRRSEQGRLYETFRDRLMFPIRDASNRVAGFGGRTLADDRAKYLNTRQTLLFDKGKGLYGIDAARDAMSRGGRAVVVEGYTDCIAAHQAGFPETAATLGTALTDAQVDLLRRYCDRIVLLFDSDEAGEAAADRAIHVALPRCVTVELARIPDGKDPSDFLSRSGPDEFSDLLNRGVDALEFKWFQTQRRFEADESNARRREAVLDFLRVVANGVYTQAVDAIQRGLLINQVAHLLRMDRREVDRLLAGLRPGRDGAGASPGQSDQSRRSRPRDGEQAAWVHVLEVLLNEPGVLGALPSLPVERIENQCDRRIAKVVLSLIEEAGEFRLADVLSRFHEVDDVERIMGLAYEGERRGNFENTFAAAHERIQQALRDEQIEQYKQRCLSAPEGQPALANVEAQLMNFHKALRERKGSGFLVRRLSLSKRLPADGAPDADLKPNVEQR